MADPTPGELRSVLREHGIINRGEGPVAFTPGLIAVYARRADATPSCPYDGATVRRVLTAHLVILRATETTLEEFEADEPEDGTPCAECGQPINVAEGYTTHGDTVRCLNCHRAAA